jgi:hypothetical protein
MLTRSLLAIGMTFLGLLVLSLPSHPAKGDEKDKKKSASQLARELEPRTFTLEAKDMPVAKVLAELAKQTGNAVEDRRANKDESKVNSLNLKDATFWQALDAIAKATDARVSLYERDNKLALVDGPYLALPVSYSGLFRVTIKRLETQLVLDADTHQCVITLEVAWEPRFQPIVVQTRPEGLVVQDDKGRAVDVPEGEMGRGAPTKKNAAELLIRIPAPQRSANQLGLFKGKLAATGPVSMVTFTFDNLSKIENAKQARKGSKEGVTLHLRELKSEGDEDDQSWTVGLFLEYAVEGAKLESFETSFLKNEVYLEKEKDGIKQQFPPNGGYETPGDDPNALFRYHFNDEPERKLVLGKFSDWKLVYRVPGKLVELPIPFEFKDVPLP